MMDPIRRSNPQVRRLIFAAGLFVAWIGFLALLAATATQPVVLSRPQFLVSELDVIGQVEQGKDGPDPEVTIREIHWRAKGMENLVGKEITIPNLKQCDGWQGPGSYILPLRKDKDTYAVVSPPMSPGFEPMKARPRIYRETLETLRQLNSIMASKKE
jgi:hypothetical protein